MEFTVDLKPREYRRAMLWHQYASTPGRRLNDLVGWGVLVLAPVMVVVFWLAAPEALSVWFWPVAVVAVSYAAYSTLMIRYQIGRRARDLPASHPALANTRYRVHEKGLNLLWVGAPDADGEVGQRTFFPWKEIAWARELRDLYLLFVSDEQILIVPKRCLPDEQQFRSRLQAALHR